MSANFLRKRIELKFENIKQYTSLLLERYEFVRDENDVVILHLRKIILDCTNHLNALNLELLKETRHFSTKN